MKTPYNNISHYILSCLLSVFLLLPLVVSSGCSGSYRDDPRLRNIGTKLSDRSLPSSEALPLLDSLEKIPDTDLSEGERHYRDFLTIKASDIGYVKHTSESLYLTVKDYFSSRHSRDMLPEVLYYGGRVYSDMGNYPIALQYFQEALDCPSDNPESLSLRGFAASQAGRLLSKLRLNDDALPYVEESIRIDHILADTLSLIYDLELAGSISTSMQAYRAAEKYFEEACCLSEGRYPDESAINRLRIGNVLYKQGNMQSAIPIIRATVNEADSMRRNYALAVAAQAYLKAGITDTAYIYAHELISTSDTLNRGIGYYVLLSDELRYMTPPDTLSAYFRRYNEWLEGRRDENMNQAAIMQHAFYNYHTHDIARQRAESERDRLFMWLMCLGLCVALAAIAFVIHLFRKERNRKGFYRNVARISIFERISPSGDLNEAEQTALDGCQGGEKASLLDRMGTADDEPQMRFLEEFHKSSLCHRLQERIEENRSIEGNKELWKEIDDFFSGHCPNFLPQLLVLTDGRITWPERQTAMLVKCGIRINDIASLLSKSKGTIVSRRDSISIKIYGEKKGSKFIDNLIRLL